MYWDVYLYFYLYLYISKSISMYILCIISLSGYSDVYVDSDVNVYVDRDVDGYLDSYLDVSYIYVINLLRYIVN